MSYLQLLRAHPGFRRLWFGQIVSECGDYLQFIALLKLFPTEGPGAAALAGLFIVRLIPWFAWAPIAGVVADRFPRGRIMVVADLARALIVLGYLLVRSADDVVLIYALSFAQESVTAFFEPARSASIPQLVDRRGLLAANSLAGATWSAMLAVGSALGGAIAVYLGSTTAFVANALTFVLSAALIGSVRIPKVFREHASAPPDRFGLASLREGARYLASHGPQASAALVKGLWGVSMGYVFLLSIYAGQVFTPPGGDPAAATGILYAARGIGALIGPLLFKRWLGDSVRGLRASIQIALPLAAVTLGALPWAPDVWSASALLVFATGSGSIVWVASTQLVQLTVPNRLQGRVFAVDQAALTMTMALSNALSGAGLARGVVSLQGATLATAGSAMVAALMWAAAMKRFGARLDAAASEAHA